MVFVLVLFLVDSNGNAKNIVFQRAIHSTITLTTFTWVWDRLCLKITSQFVVYQNATRTRKPHSHAAQPDRRYQTGGCWAAIVRKNQCQTGRNRSVPVYRSISMVRVYITHNRILGRYGWCIGTLLRSLPFTNILLVWQSVAVDRAVCYFDHTNGCTKKTGFQMRWTIINRFKVLKTPKCRSFPSRASHGGAEEEEHHSVNQLNILNCLPVYEKLQESQSACKFTRTTHQLFCSIASLHTVRARQIDALYLLKYPLLISEHNYALRSLSPSTSNHAQSQVLA